MQLAKRAQILLLGERDFPLARTTVPETQIGDVAGLFAQLLKKDPTATLSDLTRRVWRAGIAAVAKELSE